MADRVKYILAARPCEVCYDRDAVAEVTTIWGVTACLCEPCSAEYGTGHDPVLLRAGPAQEPLPTEAEARAYVEVQTFTRARPTFRGRPQPMHEYCLLSRSTAPYEQLRVLAFIRANGELRPYGRDWFHYWVHGDWTYWSLAPRTTILNRRRNDWPAY
jgi:hypothetical protein